eukprot:CAMPEP_0169317994 /NCGR_PEP_ID=MMETSP1017-20121227/7039_1 /TAXON_ID=342587 /ORGANISM="Karlodinium micrum, Strain CCMP2283" /LENGTH=54 /DNA_ID=CAMNT_0009412219 /DNA_START=15 /DNA_END=175 /DNA_ORIENTATION=-
MATSAKRGVRFNGDIVLRREFNSFDVRLQNIQLNLVDVWSYGSTCKNFLQVLFS